MSNNEPQSRNEAILQATLDGTEYTAPPQSRIESLLLQLKAAIEDGGGGGGDTQLAAKVNAIEAQLYSTIADVPTNTDSGSMDLYSKDLNTITTSGFYNAMTCTNAPATYCTLLVIGYYLSGYCTQIAADVTTGTLYTRNQTNGTWGEWSAKTNAADLAAVATSGAYSDLTGAPTLADVATSGNYADLFGAPNLATVATSGAYGDLTGTPDGFVLYPTGTQEDVSQSILARLQEYGKCELTEGTYYVSGFEMPEGTKLTGAGNKTVVRLLDSVTNGHCVRIHRYNTVCGIHFIGGDNAPTDIFTDGAAIGTRHGIYLGANADGSGATHSGSLLNIVKDCWFEYFSGGGFTAENTGGGMFAGVVMSNCLFRQCMVGLNIAYYSEYNKFTNIITYQCNIACINNGGNNVFANCTFHGVKGFIIDNSGGDMTNCAHGTCVGCTFNHIDNMNYPSAMGGGLAIDISGVNNGFIFDGCQFWYSAINIANSRGIQISDSFLAGGTPEIIVSGDYGAFFKNCVFQKQPTITVNEATLFEGCYNDSNGEAVRPNPVIVALIDGEQKNILNATANSQTVDTVTLTKNADGSYTVKTSSATTQQIAITIGTAELAAGVQYTISGIAGGGNNTFFLNYDHALADGTSNKNVYASGLDIDVGNADRITTVKLYIRSGQTVDTVLTPMICRKAFWNITKKFVPYQN